MNWLLANKTWIFSGIGVAVLGFIVRKFFLRSKGDSAAISPNRSSVIGSPVASGSNISQTVNVTTVHSTPTANSPVNRDYSKKPTPSDIRAHLDSLPAFQRNTVRTSYHGLKVCWRVRFTSLTELGKHHQKLYKTDHTHLILFRYEFMSQVIATQVNIERFPRVKITHDGTLLRLSGTISEVTVDGRVDLVDVNLEFEE
jgi:hypothetical protein